MSLSYDNSGCSRLHERVELVLTPNPWTRVNPWAWLKFV